MKTFVKKILIISFFVSPFSLNAFAKDSFKLNNSKLLFSKEPPKVEFLDIDSVINTTKELFKFSEKAFLYEINYDKTFDALAQALIASFGDEYSMYVKKEDSDTYEDERTGNYVGIGIYLYKAPKVLQNVEDEKTLYVNVESCFPYGPAERVGLKSRDLITKIDNESVIGLSAIECSKKMKGEPNTTVHLQVKRGNVYLDFDIPREKIEVPTVQYQLLDNGILYIKINEFSQKTYDQFKKTMEINRPDQNGIILDLRGNGGGDVESCKNIADYFLSKKPIFWVSFKDDRDSKACYAKKTVGISEYVPMVVLIDESSASASEILAGALQDNKRAILVGQKSFGKGVMQLSTKFNEGWLVLTVAEYNTPLKNKVHKIGITPDIVLPKQYNIDSEDVNLDLKKMMDEKVIPNYIKDHPNYSDDNVSTFVNKYLKEYKSLNEDILSRLILLEYYSAMERKDRPIVNLKYDKTLQKAISVLQNGYTVDNNN